MTTQKVDMLLEGRSQVSRYQPFVSSLYNFNSLIRSGGMTQNTNS